MTYANFDETLCRDIKNIEKLIFKTSCICPVKIGIEI